MKRFNATLLFLLITIVSFAQLDVKHDYIWLLGYSSNNIDSSYGGTVIDFNNEPPDIYYQFRELDLNETNASICDEKGKLEFYTNNVFIHHVNHGLMFNGQDLNPGEYSNDHEDTGYYITQAAIALPAPTLEDIYYLIHENYNYPSGDLSWHASKLYYSRIDMSKGGNLGAVMSKNNVIVLDTLDYGKITAVKHGNGRDWWVIAPENNSNRYHKVLVTPEGVLNSGIQAIGDTIPHGTGQAVFSPDGSKYVRNNLLAGLADPDLLSIYDFDRCTGELSNPVQFFYADSAWYGGAAISPNSRFLYITHHLNIYQYDLEAADIPASLDTVAVYDQFWAEITPTFFQPTTFDVAQLAPNGKIYINCPTSVNYLHVINQPDEKGVACDIVQHGIELPTFNSASLPNFPNYRLGVLEGSVCDTIVPVSTKEVQAAFSEVKVFPNPNTGNFNLTWKGLQFNHGKAILLNLYGQEVAAFNLSRTAQKLEVFQQDLPIGIYFLKLLEGNELIYSQKIIIN